METMESIEDEATGGGNGNGNGNGDTNHRGQLFVDSEGIHRPLQRKNRNSVGGIPPIPYICQA